jgi:hypothetical protein
MRFREIRTNYGFTIQKQNLKTFTKQALENLSVVRWNIYSSVLASVPPPRYL